MNSFLVLILLGLVATSPFFVLWWAVRQKKRNVALVIVLPLVAFGMVALWRMAMRLGRPSVYFIAVIVTGWAAALLYRLRRRPGWLILWLSALAASALVAARLAFP